MRHETTAFCYWLLHNDQIGWLLCIIRHQGNQKWSGQNLHGFIKLHGSQVHHTLSDDWWSMGCCSRHIQDIVCSIITWSTKVLQEQSGHLALYHNFKYDSFSMITLYLQLTQREEWDLGLSCNNLSKCKLTVFLLYQLLW